jgi:hypothetical protein
MDMPASRRSYLGVALKLVLLAALLAGASYAGTWVMSQFDPHLTPSTEPMLHRLVMTAMVIYVVLMMLPFVPGVEIGLGLMVMFGAKIAPLVYLGTVLALTLAFLVGRLVPQRAIADVFATLRLRRAHDLLRRLEPLDSDERLRFLLQSASTRVVPFLLRHRFVALVVALNLPGNALIGGGGGICLVAGFSRLFTFPRYMLTLALAVLPVPLVVIITGS